MKPTSAEIREAWETIEAQNPDRSWEWLSARVTDHFDHEIDVSDIAEALQLVSVRETVRLTDAERGMIVRGECPDCHKQGFWEGPRGGMSINIECVHCHQRFNVAMWQGVLVTGERIDGGETGTVH